MIKLPVVLLHTKISSFTGGLQRVRIRVIRYSQMSLWHYRLKKTAKHHTTHVAFPDLIPTQKNMRSKNNEVNKGRSS